MSDWYNFIRDIVLLRRSSEERKEDARRDIPAVIVSYGGTTTYNDEGLSFTFIQAYGADTNLAAALNMTGLKEAGTPVLVGRDPNRRQAWQILGPDPAYYRRDMVSPLGTYHTSIHAPNHQVADVEDPGPDPLRVYQSMMDMLMTEPDELTLVVTVQAYDYNIGGSSRYYAGETKDLTSSVPAATLIRKVLLYLDRETGILETVEGTAVLDNGAIPIPEPAIPDGVVGTKSAWITLANGQTAITWADWDDARDFLDSEGANELPSHTTSGQILTVNSDLQVVWGLPVIDSVSGDIVTSDGAIVFA